VFVTRARSLTSLAPKNVTGRPIGSTDLSKMNPAVGVGLGMAPPGGTVGSQIGRGPKDRLAGVSVLIVKGPNKGHAGTIRDTNGNMARVELQTSAKVITIEKEKLRRRK
jgi:transcription elongation factor SPT5